MNQGFEWEVERAGSWVSPQVRYQRNKAGQLIEMGYKPITAGRPAAGEILVKYEYGIPHFIMGRDFRGRPFGDA